MRCIGQSPHQRLLWLEMSVALRLRSPTLGKGTHYKWREFVAVGAEHAWWEDTLSVAVSLALVLPCGEIWRKSPLGLFKHLEMTNQPAIQLVSQR